MQSVSMHDVPSTLASAEKNTRYVCLFSIDFVWTNAPVLAGYHYIPLLVEDHDHRYHGCELSGGERETFNQAMVVGSLHVL